MNLTDMLLKSTDGKAVDALAEQFQLSREQTVVAIEALAPAFSVGLKRNAAGPAGLAAFIDALADGHHGQYLDEPMSAFSASGLDDGRAILGHLFASKDVSRAIAERASAATGISDSILKQMLPALASMVMGALFKGATGQGGGGLGGQIGQSAGGGLLGALLEGLIGGALSGGRSATRRRRRRTTSRRSRRSRTNPLEDILGEVFGGRPRRRTRRRAPDPIMPPSPRRRDSRRSQQRNAPGDDVFGDIFDQLTGNSARGTRSGTPRRRPPKKTRLEDIFGDMLEPGGSTDRSYQRETGDVFDELLGPTRRR